jgi:hypothetical protein
MGKLWRGFIMSNDPKFPFVGNNKPPLDSKEESVNEERTGG